MTLTLKTTRPATTEEIESLIFGTGALTWSWWDGAHRTNSGFRFTHSTEADGDGQHSGTTWKSDQAILDAAGRFLDEQTGEDVTDARSESIGYLDAIAADIVLQYAVFGEVVFG